MSAFGRGLRALLLVVAVPVLLAGCGDDDAAGGPELFVALDGSPRVPDAEGVLVEVAEDFSTLTLDGDRTYDIHEDLQSFAAADGSIQPVGRYVGNYVQVGLDGDVVQWLGSLASIVELPGADPVAYVTGVVTDVDGTHATFQSGIVLTLAPDVDLAEVPSRVVATVAVTSRSVTALEPG